MQALFRVAPVVLIDSACLYSYQRALADLVFPRPLVYSVSLARRTQPLAGRHHNSRGAIQSGIAVGARRRFKNCGREPLEANVPGVRGFATSLFLGCVDLRHFVSVGAGSSLLCGD